MTDPELDALVARAAEEATDETRLAAAVLRRARQDERPRRAPAFGPGLAVAGIAALIALTPVAIALYPADPVDGFLGLAFGRAALLTPAAELLR